MILRILHVSHKGLPEHRLERDVFVAKKKGHEMHYFRLGSTKEPSLNVFETITMHRKINNRRVALDQSIRDDWAAEVRRIDRDLIHANGLPKGMISVLSIYVNID